ncbi:MAG TPA: EamA family transporter [Polyangia bacterium]
MSRSASPLFDGAMFAVLAALSFGATTPIVQLGGEGVGPLTTAALLYLGACLSALLLGFLAPASGAPLRRAQLARLGLVALFGAALAPTLLAWGLQRSGATTGSLLLNLEALFTVVLARAFYREPIGQRVAAALAFMVLGGAMLALDSVRSLGWNALGALAIGGAALAWAIDNTLTRPLSEANAMSVVAGKSAAGAALTALLARALHEPLPSAPRAAIILACGATGYGLSLRLYLLAQRRIGAGRTGSIFAVAPFIGAALAFALGARTAGLLTGVSAVLFALGVFLHATEHHRHRHTHEPLEHEHAHRHDDDHHDHVHEPPVVGEHTHMHHHDPLEHDHDHAPDVHHGHSHA